MDMAVDIKVIKQHLIDPEICIRCNTCEATCPVGAITHDDRNYVVKADVCNQCMACISPCPTGSIDNWRTMPLARAYTILEQFGWDELPAELPPEQLGGRIAAEPEPATEPAVAAAEAGFEVESETPSYGATTPPWSAAHAYTNLYPPKKPTTATVVGNFNCTEAGYANQTHHIVLDFGTMPFPVLEGQSIGIVPPGADAQGRPHHARQYSIASPRNGERPGYNNLALTVKRVLEDHQGRPVRGVASNYVCDLKVGDKVQVIGPFGHSFLMPNHPKSNIVMVCTGTGSAPMRAMT
ncbi:MAG: benzoyl-CoA 2,3-epoxidase subunit BoxA, partial [Proteobacteria bacterium]|nr:benzoyl-CoA 2,3-epoxidase subunit BoxA [Pseudomonadota bacterium]